MTDLTRVDLSIIEEEETTLKQLVEYAKANAMIESRDDLLKQVYSVREALSEAKEDEVAQLTEQLSRLMSLVNQTDQSLVDGVDVSNPYFAHMRLKEEKRIRNIFIGTNVYCPSDIPFQIVDWKVSPISMLYYRYEEGEEYEEDIGGRIMEGTVEFKRIIKVHNGTLVRISHGGSVYEKDDNGSWIKNSQKEHSLHGGAGIAPRAENLKKGNPKMGVGLRQEADKTKLLKEITGLIDSEQFSLITKPKSGVVAIQGTAGSGKTTVALHRVSWLHYQDPTFFKPEKMAIVVFSKALARYISKVLPSLGVKGVNIHIFEEWMSQQRRNLFGPLLPSRYAEFTPVSVIRFKKHPALLKTVKTFLENKEHDFDVDLKEIISSKGVKTFPFEDLKKIPFISRLYIMHKWVSGHKQFKKETFSYGTEVKLLILKLMGKFVNFNQSRVETVLQCWDELFSDFTYLREQYFKHAEEEFSEVKFKEITEWLKKQYVQRQSSNRDRKDGLMVDEATLDNEDDPILLLFYQKLLGKGFGKTDKGLPKYRHLMIDEAQDLCALELSVMMGMTTEPHSVTLAGDVNQKLIEHGGFDSWELLFKDLGLEGEKISALKVSYRSTYEIMNFAISVLDGAAYSKEVKAKRNGPPVELFKYENQGEMLYNLSNTLNELIRQEPGASVALICLTPESAKGYYEQLDRMEVANIRLIKDQEFSFTAGIDITDIRQVKGLEFDYVILMDVDTVNYPDNKYARYLLHIGATRASHQLWMMNYRLPSPMIPQNIVEASI